MMRRLLLAFMTLVGLVGLALAQQPQSQQDRDRDREQRANPPFCVESGPTNRPYYRLCLQADPDKGGIISFSGHNGAKELPLLCDVNGDVQPCGRNGAWTVVSPLGKDRDDADNINRALEDSERGVILDGGTFTICKTIVVPRNKGLTGVNTGMYFSTTGGNPVPWPAAASISPTRCSSIRAFDAGTPTVPIASLIFLHDNTFLQGFAVTGFNTMNQNDRLACVSGTNTVGVTIRNMVLANCATAIRLFSDGARRGDQGVLVTQSTIHNNTLWTSGAAIDFETINAGAGCSDLKIWNNQIQTIRTAGIIMEKCTGFQITDNRIEDGTAGIQGSPSQGVVAGNVFNNLSKPMTFDGGYGLLVHANQMTSSTTAGTGMPCVTLTGNLTGSTFVGDSCLYGYQGFFKFSGATPKANMFVENFLTTIGGPPMFFDQATDTALSPFFIATVGEWTLLQTQLTAFQSQLTALTNRLNAAGIP